MTQDFFLPALLAIMTCGPNAGPPDLASPPGASADLAAPEDGGTGTGRDGAVGAPDLASGDGGGGGGVQAFCAHYKRCGGRFYDDAASCVKALLDYWHLCRLPELDAFGWCMVAKVPCGNWNPDEYNAGTTPCAPEWEKVQRNMCAPIGSLRGAPGAPQR